MNDTLILIFLLFLSGAFSGSETALTAVSLARAEALEREGQGGAKALLKLKLNSTRMLITLLIGNNLVNIGASAFATVVATEHLGALGPGVAVGVLFARVDLVGREPIERGWRKGRGGRGFDPRR